MIVTTFVNGLPLLVSECFNSSLAKYLPGKADTGEIVVRKEDLPPLEDGDVSFYGIFETYTGLLNGDLCVKNPGKTLSWGLCYLAHTFGCAFILTSVMISQAQDHHYYFYLTDEEGECVLKPENDLPNDHAVTLDDVKNADLPKLFDAEMEIDIARKYNVEVGIERVNEVPAGKLQLLRDNHVRVKYAGENWNKHPFMVSHGSHLTADRLLREEYGNDVYDYVTEVMQTDGVEIAGGLPGSLINPVWYYIPIANNRDGLCLNLPRYIELLFTGTCRTAFKHDQSPIDLVRIGVNAIENEYPTINLAEVKRNLGFVKADTPHNMLFVYTKICMNWLIDFNTEHPDVKKAVSLYIHVVMKDMLYSLGDVTYLRLFRQSGDVDIFFIGTGPKRVTEAKKVADNFIDRAKVDGKLVCDFYTPYSISFKVGLTKIQLVKRVYSSLSEILAGFDLGSSQCALSLKDHIEVVGTDLFRISLMYQITAVNPNRKSSTFCKRLIKYRAKGYEIWLPKGLDHLLQPLDEEPDVKHLHTISQLALMMRGKKCKEWSKRKTLDWYGAPGEENLKDNYNRSLSYTEYHERLKAMEEESGDEDGEWVDEYDRLLKEVAKMDENPPHFEHVETFEETCPTGICINGKRKGVPRSVIRVMLGKNQLFYTDYIREVDTAKRYLVCGDLYRNVKWSGIYHNGEYLPPTPEQFLVLSGECWISSEPGSQATGSFDPTSNDFFSSEVFEEKEEGECQCTINLRNEINETSPLLQCLNEIVVMYTGGAHHDGFLTMTTR